MTARALSLALSPLAVLALASCDPAPQNDVPPPSGSGPALVPPRFERWIAPASSEIETHLAALEPALPSVALEAPPPDLIESIDEVVDAWDPSLRAPEDPLDREGRHRWERNQLHLADLNQWNTQALHRMRARVLDEQLPSEQRFALVAKIAAFENTQAATVLEQILQSAAPPDLRARAAFQLSRATGDWILEGLLAKFAPEFQNGTYFIPDYYERDEYTELWIAEGLCARGILSPLPYMLELEQRASSGGPVDSIYAASALQADAERLLRQICVRETVEFAPDAARDAMRARANEIAAHWKRVGRAPISATDPPFTVDDQSRLCARLCHRMLAFRTEKLGAPLRPVDEARRILVDLGAASLPMLRRGLRDPNLFVREYTLDVAIRLGPPAAPLSVEILPLLGDPLSRVKALEALGALGPQPEVERWQGLVLADDAETAQAAAEALAMLESSTSVPWLLAACTRSNDGGTLRIALAAALCVQGRLEGPALWLERAEFAAQSDPLWIARLLERSAVALERQTRAPWPRELAAFGAEVRRLVESRGKSGPL